MPFTIPADSSTVTKDDLRRLTPTLFDALLQQLRRCVDADVTFVPVDPFAVDHDAQVSEEASLPWTLGHILVHVTATAEESAALAAELARGVAYHGRSRQEVPWHTMTTVAHCRARLRESRRMCSASLEMWPDRPELGNTYVPWEGAAPMGPVARFLLGLQHGAQHLEQVRAVVGQARTARRQQTRVGRGQRWWRSRFRSPTTNGKETAVSG